MLRVFVALLSSLALFAGPASAAAAAPLHCSIWSDKQSYAPGETARFQWLSVNARTASIDGVGPVALSGFWRTPVERSGYITLRVRGEGERICTVNYTVRAQRPTCHISAIPLAVAQNSFVTLSWSTQYATRVSISGIGTVPASGSRVVRAERSGTYTLTAVGAGGSCTMPTTISVQSPVSAYGYFPTVVNSIAAPLFGYSQNQSSGYFPSYYDSYYQPATEVWYEDTYYEPGYWYEEMYSVPSVWPEHENEDWDDVADDVWIEADLSIDPHMEVPPPLEYDIYVAPDICADDWCREWGAESGVGETIDEYRDPAFDWTPRYDYAEGSYYIEI